MNSCCWLLLLGEGMRGVRALPNYLSPKLTMCLRVISISNRSCCT